MYLQSRNDFLLQLTATEATFDSYFSSSLPKLLDTSSLGFHNIVRRAFRASLQSERNLLSDRLGRVDQNLKLIETINLQDDRNAFKKQMPEMFKAFELGVTVQDRQLSINEDLFVSLEKQRNTLDANLSQIEKDYRTADLRVADSMTQLMNNLPHLSEAMPPANSRGT